MFIKSLRGAGLLILALIIGCGSAIVRVRSIGQIESFQIGPWRSTSSAGSLKADAVTRAAVAVNALMAMTREEAIYFIADHDSEGYPLSGQCRYRIEGVDPDVRWWSLTVYGQDRFLVPNPAHRYSVSQESVRRRAPSQPDARGPYAVTLSRQAPPAATPAEMPESQDWIALPDGPFLLTLRLYQPATAVLEHPQQLTLPTIHQESCT